MKSIKLMFKTMVIAAALFSGLYLPNRVSAQDLTLDPGDGVTTVTCYCNSSCKCVANGDGRTQCNSSDQCWNYDSKCS